MVALSSMLAFGCREPGKSGSETVTIGATTAETTAASTTAAETSGDTTTGSTGASESSTSSEGESETETTGEAWPDCSANHPDPNPELVVEMHNVGADTLYLKTWTDDPQWDGFFFSVDYEMMAAANEQVLNVFGQCIFRCNSDYWCPWSFDYSICEPEEGHPAPVAIAPGAVFVARTWRGRAPTEMPDQCLNQLCPNVFTMTGTTPCLRPVPFLGLLKLRAHIASEVLCEGEPCSCTPGPQGWCRVTGGELPVVTPVDTLINFPEELKVTVELSSEGL